MAMYFADTNVYLVTLHFKTNSGLYKRNNCGTVCEDAIVKDVICLQWTSLSLKRENG